MQLRYALQETAASLLPGWRVGNCMRARYAGQVSVIAHPQHASASYAGLQTCGSVWVCPVCSARIAARRQADIEAAAASWRARGGGFLLVTFTLRHTRADSLASVLGQLNEAHRRARGGRVWRRIEQEFGIVGAITSRENTVGANGWHPHLHAIWFTEKPLTPEAATKLRATMAARWIAALGRVGGDANKRNGFDLQTIDTSSDASFKAALDYPVKHGAQWSAADELAGGQAKQAKGGNRSIAELLRAAALGDDRAAALFVEYAAATKGRNLIVWTPGLRELCNLAEPEKTDGELAEEQEAGGQLVVVLPPDQWRMVCYDQLRGKLLAALQRGGREELERWFDLHKIPIEPWQWSAPGG